MTDQAVFDELVGEVRGVFFALRGISEALLADLDCTGAERSLLVELEQRGARTVPVLARGRAVSRQAMQKVVDRLTVRRWLRDEPNPDHARSPLVAITPAGRRVLVEIRTRETAMLASAKLPVAPAELRRAAATLAQLGGFLNALEVRPGGRR
jgi:DNA-binding MarR family transcriptional regulator